MNPRWADRGGDELEAVLKSGAVRLLDSRYLVALAKKGGVLAPRQCLPDDAFLTFDEVRQLAPPNPDYPMLKILCISHCWLQPDHPDLRGHNLREIGNALENLCSEHGLDRAAVFHQCCRNRISPP